MLGKVGGVWEGFDDQVEDEKEQREKERKDENEEDDSVDGGDGGVGGGWEVGIDRRRVNLPIRGG